MKKIYRQSLSATLLGVIALYFFSCTVPKKGPRKAFAMAARFKPFDAIIVPGVPFVNGRWDSVMKARVLWACELYRCGYAKNIIFSGAAVYSPYKEAVIMGLYAQALGVPADVMYYDTLARHSTENVYYSYLLAKKLGFKTLALATDPFQSIMLRSFTRKRFESPIYHIPFVTDSLKEFNKTNPVIDPQPAHVSEFTSIVEKESLRSRLRGTFGKDIPWKKYKNRKVDKL